MLAPADIWRRLGGSGDPPDRLFGRSHGPLLILGGARCVWADLARVLPWRGHVMAVNDIGAHYHGPVMHWATLHPEYACGWRRYRHRHGYGSGYAPTLHASTWAEGVDCVWELANVGDTSGLFGCYIGLLLGYETITLAGIPADNTGHFFDPPWEQASGCDPRLVRDAWQWARDEVFDGRVASLSGNTRDWLGAPLALPQSCSNMAED